MSRKYFPLFSAVFFILLTQQIQPAFSKEIYIPPSLSEWSAWIMHGNEDKLCPSAWNSNDSRECFWPGTLEISADDKGGSFSQTWTVSTEGFVPVPGDAERWPMNVMLDNKKAAATMQNEIPSVYLKPGEYRLSGVFRWHAMPARLKIPDTTAIVNLTVKGKKEKSPVVDESGFLWLSGNASGSGTVAETPESRPENRMDVKIYRMIDDVYPLEITTAIQLSISGEVRRESLAEETLLSGTFPASVSSPLPLKIDENGIVRFEARPGTWNVVIKSIMEDIHDSTIKAGCPYGAETWTFRPHPELRNVRIEGADAVDPGQTTMPEEWKQFSSYLVKQDQGKKNQGIILNEIRRGSGSQAESDLTLFRDLWLDFDGTGAVVRDHITGNLERRIFLGLEKNDYRLGRVTSKETDQLITELDGNLGTEMEKGHLDMTAVSGIEKMSLISTFPVGWNTKFREANGYIHIPPGWRLLGTGGGTVPDRSAWIDRWTLLDVFTVMLISVAVAKMWGILWGLAFFVGLSLIAHEPFAPKSLWILITVTAAVSAVIENSSVRSQKTDFAVKAAHVMACILLAGSGILFCYTQIRLAIYPQLENRLLSVDERLDVMPAAQKEAVMQSAKPRMMAKSEPAPAPSMKDKRIAPQEAEEMVVRDLAENKAEPAPESGAAPSGDISGYRFDYSAELQEKSVTQTGPGLPEWRWKTVPVEFGSVGENHKFSIWLAPPFVNTAAGFIRVFLFIILASRFINANISGVFKNGMKIPQIAVLAALAVLVPVYQSGASEIPDQAMLKELENRILEPAPCYPECASCPYMKITLAGDSRKAVMEMDIDAAIKTAVPFPSGSGTWEISSASINRNQTTSVIRRDGLNWILVPEGSSRITVSADVKSLTNLKFSFPIKPMFVDVQADGWVITGLDENSQVQTELLLTRQSEKFGKNEASRENSGENDEEFSESSSGLKGYMRVERIISLGIEWKTVTRISRLHETGGPDTVAADIPLIEGEIVHNSKIKTRNGTARVEIGAGENQVEWASSIPVKDEIKMKIPENPVWGEVWHVNASSIWHLSSSGVPEVHRDGIPGTFWYPRKGETLSIKAKRLEGAEGDSTTIDSVKIDYHAGREFSRVVMGSRIRTSQGGILPVKTPEGTTLKTVRINGSTVPLAESSGKVNVPLQPGIQNLDIEWTEKQKSAGFLADAMIPKILEPPVIDIGRPSSNIDISIHTPEKIWILLTFGPRLGPAVLFWGYLVIVIAGAFILGRFSPVPLKTSDWLLLGIGLAPLGPGAIIFTVMWFYAVHLRSSKQPEKKLFFRIMQATLLLSTFITAMILYSAVKNGLLGIPDMQIDGNGSSEALLKWTLDRSSSSSLPCPFALTVSIYVFRLLMFAWAVWLAFRIVEWSKWAYSAFRHNGIWNRS